MNDVINEKCVICEANFRPGFLKEGKCPTCLKEHPDAKNKLEAMAGLEKAIYPAKEYVTVEDVQTIIKVAIADLKAELLKPPTEETKKAAPKGGK